nr:MAG TPA: hypothetical protein [Caudoviricetes sp.]
MEPRKPVVTTAGLPAGLAKALEPVKQTLEMLTGRRSNVREMTKLDEGATQSEMIEKINAIMARLNGSGEVK